MTTQTANSILSHRIGADGLFVVRVHDGSIRMRGVGGDVATVRAADGRPLGGLEFEPGERSLAIGPRRGPDFLGFGRRDRGGRGRAKDLQLEIPAGATVIVEGASADVDVHGMHGDQRYRSASGDLVLADVRGSLTIDAVSGDIEIAADGPASITARTVSGNLDLRAGSIAEMHATTTSGDMRISGRFDGSGPYTIETVSGDATVAPMNDIRVEGATITGDVDSELPSRRDDTDGRRAVIIGAGGPTITFRSTSGDLRIVAAARLAASVPPIPPKPPEPAAPPIPPEPAVPPMASALPPGAGSSAEADDPRLGILRDLERGDIDVAEAGRRLEAMDPEQLAADEGDAADDPDTAAGRDHDHA